jgi:hypothetical protein
MHGLWRQAVRHRLRRLVGKPAFAVTGKPGRRPVLSVLPRSLSVDSAAADGHLAVLRRDNHSFPAARYWADQLSDLSRSSAAGLVAQLSWGNPLGYDSGKEGLAKPGTLLRFAMDSKAKHPEKVLLLRVGDFYEAFGVDAVMLVEHAGLNPMAGKCRAGCPWRNIQNTLDSLTDAGLGVAVYEELNSTKGRTKSIKDRYLAQVVTPGYPTYLYDLNLYNSSLPFRQNRPYIGICSTTSGYVLVEVCVDSRVVTVRERLTQEVSDSEVPTIVQPFHTYWPRAYCRLCMQPWR